MNDIAMERLLLIVFLVNFGSIHIAKIYSQSVKAIPKLITLKQEFQY